MPTLMEKIMTIMTATKRVAWDEIPDNVFQEYERKMAMVERTADPRTFRELAVEVYNKIFGAYGYTKPAL